MLSPEWRTPRDVKAGRKHKLRRSWRESKNGHKARLRAAPTKDTIVCKITSRGLATATRALRRHECCESSFTGLGDPPLGFNDAGYPLPGPSASVPVIV
jgi:hypothetical protein